MTFFLTALVSAVAVGLLRSWSLASGARAPIQVVPQALPALRGAPAARELAGPPAVGEVGRRAA